MTTDAPDPPQTAIVVTIPDGAKQVLVRIEGQLLEEDTVTVDFRQDPKLHRINVWTPAAFFPDSVEIRKEGEVNA